jgi:hypothetical protein
MVGLLEERAPEAYDLCSQHAGRTTPPHGWTLIDRRPAESDAAERPDEGYGGADTVAVLAAALRGDAPGRPGADGQHVDLDGTPLGDLDLGALDLDDLDLDDEGADLRLALEELQAVALDRPGPVLEMRRTSPTQPEDDTEGPGRPPLACRD